MIPEAMEKNDIDVFEVVVQPIEYYTGFGSYFKRQEHWK